MGMVRGNRKASQKMIIPFSGGDMRLCFLIGESFAGVLLVKLASCDSIQPAPAQT